MATQRQENTHEAPTRAPRAQGPVQDTLADPLSGHTLSDPLTVQADNGLDAKSSEAVRSVASEGLSGSGGTIPYSGEIQSSFGSYDVSGIQAHTDTRAQTAAAQIGANGYSSGDHIALGAGASKHTVAHEAAHSVVSEHSNVQLSNGVGSSGDRYEKHADTVADAVVSGKSAEPLLDRFLGN